MNKYIMNVKDIQGITNIDPTEEAGKIKLRGRWVSIIINLYINTNKYNYRKTMGSVRGMVSRKGNAVPARKERADPFLKEEGSDHATAPAPGSSNIASQGGQVPRGVATHVPRAARRLFSTIGGVRGRLGAHDNTRRRPFAGF